MNRGPLLVLPVVLAAGLAACAKAPPQLPAVTTLSIPAPPARNVIPVEIPEYVEPEPVPEITEVPEPPPARPATNNRSTEKPATPPAAAPAAPPPTLRTQGNPGVIEQRITGLLGTAEQRLKAVNFRDLNAAGRQHYEQARDFIRMANEQLSIRNYSLAEVLATRATRVLERLGKS